MPRSKQEVIDIIDSMYGDTSVSPATTLGWLEEIGEHVESLIDGLKYTMADDDEIDADV